MDVVTQTVEVVVEQNALERLIVRLVDSDGAAECAGIAEGATDG